MNSRFFNISVFIMWLLTMTWLITQKMIPSFWVGQPPSYQTILEAQQREPPVGWTMLLNDKRLGWALSSVVTQDRGSEEIKALDQGPKEIHSWVHFDNLPIQELTAGWNRAIFRLIDQSTEQLAMDVHNSLTIDSLGKLLRFDSRVQLEATKNVLRMQGVVQGTQLHVELHSGDFAYSAEAALPQNALLSDALSPQTQLPNLAKGQTWTVPVLSPFRPTSSAMEILYAVVEEKEPIYWDSDMHDAWVVTYKNDPGVSFESDSGKRGKLWVLEDGTVIKQQVLIFDSKLCFIRMNRQESERLEKKCQKKLDNDE
jgi:hypothetical protein